MKYRGVVLAAGLGTRLQPWTQVIPKALFPFFDRPILEGLLTLLEQNSVVDIAVNAHHHAEQIKKFVSDRNSKATIFISHETPEILGSGGAFPPLQKWANTDHLIVINGDVVTDVNLAELIALHEKENACVTMTGLSTPLKRSDRFLVCNKNQLSRFSRAGENLSADEIPRGNAGISIYSYEFLHMIPQHGASSILDTMEKALQLGRNFCVYEHRGFWHSLDDQERFLKAQQDYFDHFRDDPLRLMSKGASLIDAEKNVFIGGKVRLVKDQDYSFDHVMIFGEGILKPGQYSHQVIMLKDNQQITK